MGCASKLHTHGMWRQSVCCAGSEFQTRLFFKGEDMNYFGIIIGIISIAIIGIWHLIVIKGEYYFGRRKCVVVFAIVGIGCIGLSVFVGSKMLSGVLALNGFSSLWGIREVIEQERRVARGWFPKREGR